MKSGSSNPVAASTSASKAKRGKRGRALSSPTECRSLPDLRAIPVNDSDSPASLEHREAANQDRRPSQLYASFEELDVEIRPPPLRPRGSRKDLSLVLDYVVAANNLIAVETVVSVVEIDLRRLAPKGCVHVADNLAAFPELEIPREQSANCNEQSRLLSRE